MIDALKNHPFAVEAHFDSSTVLTFASPKEQLEKLIPVCLELDTFQDKWAFLAIAMVQTKDLRPKGFPRFLGNDFFLIGYRIFVRYVTARGKRLRGLYIIKSETNRKKMEIFGNLFTHYSYTTTDVTVRTEGQIKSISSAKSKFDLKIALTQRGISMPEASPFNEWKEARRFAGPLPFTFTYNSSDKSVLIIEGVRQNWKPRPIQVESYNFDYLNRLNLEDVVLTHAFEITDIPYYWKSGVKESWK